MLIDSNDILKAIADIIKENESIEYHNEIVCNKKAMDHTDFRLSILSEKISLLKLAEKLSIN
jgi:hypothetical protein